MRQVVLDTETTGLDWQRGHRVVEIGCLELVGRRLSGRQFQRYLNPEREVDSGAQEVTGLSREFLADKPRFIEVVDEFLDFIRDAELIIHNAEFDVGFLDAELARLGPGYGRIADHARVIDSLALARERFPGQRNSLDALCRRLGVDNSGRELHGALLDAQLLAEVYLALTSGQGDLDLTPAQAETAAAPASIAAGAAGARRVIRADAQELAAHERRLEAIEAVSGRCLWRRLEPLSGGGSRSR